jgi:hypothetical protein
MSDAVQVECNGLSVISIVNGGDQRSFFPELAVDRADRIKSPRVGACAKTVASSNSQCRRQSNEPE